MTESGDPDHASHRAIDADLLTNGLTDLARELARAGFEALWRHNARAPHELMRADRKTVAEVIAALVARGRCELDDDGRLIGIHGLTLQSTRHHFVHEGLTHGTWCAFDAVGIPAALEIDATATTDCPTCGRLLRIELTAGAPADTNRFALWLPTATGDHLMNSFCPSADIYCSVDHLQQRIDRTTTAGEITSLTRAGTLGGEMWADIVDQRTLTD